MAKQDDRYFSLDHPVELDVTDLTDGSFIGRFTGRVGDVSELVELIAKAREADAAVAA